MRKSTIRLSRTSPPKCHSVGLWGLHLHLLDEPVMELLSYHTVWALRMVLRAMCPLYSVSEDSQLTKYSESTDGSVSEDSQGDCDKKRMSGGRGDRRRDPLAGKGLNLFIVWKGA